MFQRLTLRLKPGVVSILGLLLALMPIMSLMLFRCSSAQHSPRFAEVKLPLTVFLVTTA
jgi:hypothetical protein